MSIVDSKDFIFFEDMSAEIQQEILSFLNVQEAQQKKCVSKAWHIHISELERLKKLNPQSKSGCLPIKQVNKHSQITSFVLRVLSLAQTYTNVCSIFECNIKTDQFFDDI
ncbi:MAG: hypothetical protein K0S74_1592 [Chlamydiales bacterium]|jgi:hypothetical protein|nr:hypothetical protein [Chlamydiales bacterium]